MPVRDTRKTLFNVDSYQQRCPVMMSGIVRLWLERERNNPRYRCKKRRNGKMGPGPMTMSWRRLALRKLLQAQGQSGLPLIEAAEISAIRAEWEKDDAE